MALNIQASIDIFHVWWQIVIVQFCNLFKQLDDKLEKVDKVDS
jgi:hypothetical protein